MLPFSSMDDLYKNTQFRVAVMPDTTMMDNFKFSTDPLWKAIYDERIEPNVEEYRNYPDHTTDMMYFIRDDMATALFDGYIPQK